jgi:hypothetical protein
MSQGQGVHLYPSEALMPDLPLSSAPVIYAAGVVCILILGGLVAVVKSTTKGITALRAQIREDYGTESFRAAVASAMDSRAVTAPIERIVEATVVRTVGTSFSHITDSIRDLAGEQRTMAGRLSTVESKVEGILARSREQRRGDLPLEGQG